MHSYNLNSVASGQGSGCVSKAGDINLHPKGIPQASCSGTRSYQKRGGAGTSTFLTDCDRPDAPHLP